MMTERIAQLQTENSTLRARYEETAALFDSVRARSESLEMKLTDIDDLRRQVSTLKEANDDLIERNKSLERELQSTSEVIDHKEDELKEQKRLNQSLSSSFNSHLQAKSSILENLQGENRELTTRITALEHDKQRSLSTISDIEADLRQTQRENAGLTQACERLSRKVEKLTMKLSRASPHRKS